MALLAAAAPAFAASAKPELGSFGFDTAGMDRSVKPGDDWVRFTNGGYTDKLVIPADRTNFGMFTKLRDLSQERTRKIIEGSATAASTAAKGTETQKVGDYYASFMDEAAAETKGITPIKPILSGIDAIKDRKALAAEMGTLGRDGIDMPIGAQVMGDLKNPDVITAYVGQGGLGLPDRDYYLDTKNPKFAEVRTKYVEHIGRMLALAGLTNAPARAQAVYDLERKIAQVHWSQVEQRQVEKLYNPVASSAIATTYPGVDWAPLLASLGLSAQKELIVAQPSAVTGIAKLIASEPLPVWKDYLTMRTLESTAPLLSKAFVDENFAFNGTVLGGQPENQPRWKRATDATSNALGEAVGSLYVAQYFPPEAKVKADELVKNIIAAMDERLSKLEWMDPKTRVAAREKLAAFTPKIGYPEKWLDYSKLEVVRGDSVGNAMRYRRFEYDRQLAKIGKPVDRTEWGMTPMTVNAYANPLWNEIVFPAAILQPPFFDANADAAVNYGGIGMVIGHEITHHFDDQGRKFDKRGRLADWWTPADITRFKALTDKVVAQYGAYEPLPGSKVNGELTLGENIADLAGITIAYDAYQRSLGGKPDKVIDGFTGDQRFYLGASQIWRQKYRDAAMLRGLTTDPHTPGNYRPYVARNFDTWYAAFGAKPGEKLYLAPADRLKLW
ncbi:peptidase M13 [Polymorphobacter glacialis]|uniref:Peptidase M13 n=2 Tax=Sandarakinorhabdus glacialis TaxID=1614636 RepID=A0A916ZN28_9SPHN|nr:peptidase M13 [Polymorphobacter glacialis]